MNRNMLKIPSMLFLSLALATACSKDPEKKENKGSVNIGSVVEEAKKVQGTINGFPTTDPYDKPGVVRGAACFALSRVDKLASDLLATSGDDVKPKLSAAMTAIDKYLKSDVGTAAADELAEAKKVADQVVQELS